MVDPLELITLRVGDAVATVRRHGGQVASWVIGDRKILFASESAGPHVGIPILFPQFGAFGPGEFHGFVRNESWEISLIDHARCVATLRSRKLTCKSDIELSEDQLTVCFSVSNTSSDEAMSFTCGLHTYLRIENLSNVSVKGLRGTTYLDATSELRSTKDDEECLRFHAQVDRVYLDTPSPLIVMTGNHDVEIHQAGYEDTVVWNPGSKVGASFNDLSEDEWREFVCIEAAQIQNPVTLQPGEHWSGSQSIRVR